MGAENSRDLGSRAQEASFNELAEDSEVQEYIKSTVWPQASDATRKLLSDLTHTPRDRLKPIFDATITNALPPWHFALLQELAMGDLEPVLSRLTLCKTQAYLNLQSLLQMKEPSYTDNIVRRCQLCIFHLLRERYDRENPGSKYGAGAFPVAVVSSFPGRDPKIAPNVRSWTRSGSLLCRLASDMGGLGIIFVLPDAISRSTWENHLTPTSPRYNEAIDYLRSSGLCDIAEQTGAYQAGSRLATSLGLIHVGSGLLCLPSTNSQEDV